MSDYDFSPGLMQEVYDQMQDFHEEYSIERQEGEFTTRDYADANNVNIRKARSILNKAVENGLVERRPEPPIQGRPSYYRFVEE
jgi:predicted transcriptional regulator